MCHDVCPELYLFPYLIQLSYVIAEPRPASVTVDTQHTGMTKMKDEELSQIIADKFPLTPRWITQRFGLDHPSEESFLYADIAAKGQIGYAESHSHRSSVSRVSVIGYLQFHKYVYYS